MLRVTKKDVWVENYYKWKKIVKVSLQIIRSLPQHLKELNYKSINWHIDIYQSDIFPWFNFIQLFFLENQVRLEEKL